MNIKLCLHCQTPIEGKNKNKKKFCNLNCSAKHVNHFLPRRKKSFQKAECLNCNKQLLDKQLGKNKFCCFRCSTDFSFKNKKEKFEKGENLRVNSVSLRLFLLKLDGNQCSKCQ